MTDTDNANKNDNKNGNSNKHAAPAQVIDFKKNKAVFVEQKKEKRFKKIQAAFKQAFNPNKLKRDNKKNVAAKKGKSGKRKK